MIEIEPILDQIIDNKIVQKDYVVHFSKPANNSCSNVIHTYSMMLILKNETEIDIWCKQQNKPKGKVFLIEQVWELAKIWHYNFLTPNFKRKTKEIAQKMFKQVRLIFDFWKL